MKLSQWAKQQGIHYQTAYRWFLAGKMPVEAYRTPTGGIYVHDTKNSTEIKQKETYIYCRVSSYEKKDDLERQIKRCTDFCETKGWAVKSIVKEIASGMNDNRKQLNKLIKLNPNRIVVENKDRLTRFGFNYMKMFLTKLNCELIVINEDETKENDLMRDLISVITSFCCRLYGLRRGYNKAKKIKQEIYEESN